jgi:hypothetical protein
MHAEPRWSRTRATSFALALASIGVPCTRSGERGVVKWRRRESNPLHQGSKTDANGPKRTETDEDPQA